MVDESLDLLDGLDIDIPDLAPGPVAPGPGAPSPAAPAPDSQDSAQFFGPYQLITQVGFGGVAKVFRARHIHPSYADKTFAIKILHDELSRDPKVIELFTHEAYILSLLKQPAIVQTFEAGRQDDKLFIAMEYIDGRDLDNLMVRASKSKVTVPMPVSMYIAGEALRALTYAHELTDSNGNRLNLIHRDVNPANVFMSYDGRVKLGDFGVASITAGKLEREREIAGKAGYFAPEQLDGDSVDHRADLFAMGVMIFEMLTGQRLFEADSADKVMRLNKKAKIPKPSKLNPDIPSALEEAMLTALERKPEERFSTGREMLAALQPFLPPPGGMTLAVAALMRKIFLNEHMKELQLNEGLAGGHSRGSGQLITVCTADPRAQAAFNELLMSRGYRVEVQGAYQGLSQAVHRNAPHALLVDVNSSDFDAGSVAEAIEPIPHPVPVVAVSEGLDGESIRRADSVHAVDLLFKPFNIERVLTSVRAAVTGAAKIATVDPAASALVPTIRPRVLLLSKDNALIKRLKDGLTQRHYEVEIVQDASEALQCTSARSYHAVVYDAHPASPADRFFASHFRGRPGMGLVPIMYLAAPEAHTIFAGVDSDRSAVRPREDSAVVLAQTLNRLRGDTRLGRTFIRYPAAFPVEVRYGGRVFRGESIDVSRGGILVKCTQMPPVGTDIAVKLKIPGVTSAVQVNGRVARVDMAKEGDGAGIGIEFEKFAGNAEAGFITFLGTLDQAATKQRSTVIMAAPPPAAKG